VCHTERSGLCARVVHAGFALQTRDRVMPIGQPGDARPPRRRGRLLETPALEAPSGV